MTRGTMRDLVGVVCVVLACWAGEARGVVKLKVGVMLISGTDVPYSMERVGPAIHLALDKVNSEILNGSYQLVPVERAYDSICSARNATGVAADLFYHENIVALIGPSCAYALDGVARLAGFWNIPIVTGLGDGGMFKNKTDYPTLTRFAYCQCRLRKVFGSVFKQFDWTDIVVIYDVNDAHSDILGQTLKVGLQKGNIFPYMIAYYGNQNPDFSAVLKQAAEHSRVIVLIVPGESLRLFLLAALELGYTTNGEFVFMDVELFPFPGDYWGNHHWKRGDARDTDAFKAFDSLLKISLHEPDSEEWRNFSCDVIRLSSDNYNFTYGEEKVNYFIGGFHDGVVRYGMAINETIESGNVVTDGWAVARRMWDKTTEGVTGDVIIDDNGDRDTDFAILDLNMDDGEFQVVANYWGERPGYTAIDTREIHWPGPLALPPKNSPPCGFMGFDPSCQTGETIPIYVTVVLIFLGTAVVSLVVGILIYRRYQWEKDLKDTSWRVNFLDIKFRNKTNDSVRFSKTSIAWLSEKEQSLNSSDMVAEQRFTRIGIYQGETVAVKRVECDRVDLNRRTLLEFKQVRDLQHENLARFVGAVIEPSKNFLLTEYCNKGSLQDVLQNDNIKLDWTFRLSLLRDIARGMSFMHRSVVGYHGNLRSSNCVVDSKFSLKVTDYGLPSLRSHRSAFYNDNTHAKFEKLLWVAPEHLSDERGSQKGDVYSFSIILEEMIVRSAPYDTYRGIMDPEDIIERVAAHDKPPFRPKVNQAFGPKGVHLLMHKCWVDVPEERPSFDSISKELRSLQGSKTDNIVEALIHRLEDYASNLEDIVEDRTQQLIAEKKKSEALLYQILPKSVAEQLKQGKSVVPETYESVTIYFSDIVGFTSMCSESTPMEVVSFLNDLYSLFDSVIDNFDVYKVETIGDAYMVVSGVPERNGQRHAVEICRLSLSLIEGVKTFVFRHRPEDELNVRIGIHSGPCAAGVVGLKMPRYCLFGDTVNTTSRLESTGEPSKIHLSGATKRILDEVGNFKTELRGEVAMKGKGLQTTYWLKGENGKDPPDKVEKERDRKQSQKSQEARQEGEVTGQNEAKETDSGVQDISTSEEYNTEETWRDPELPTGEEYNTEETWRDPELPTGDSGSDLISFSPDVEPRQDSQMRSHGIGDGGGRISQTNCPSGMTADGQGCHEGQGNDQGEGRVSRARSVSILVEEARSKPEKKLSFVEPDGKVFRGDGL